MDNSIILMKPKLIIFDFDGVLVDSEIIGHKIHAIEITRLGFSLTVEKSIELFTGITKTLFDEIMLREYGKTISDKDLLPIIKKIDDEIVTNVKSIVGIIQVLNYLVQREVNKCIATNGANNYVASTLVTTNLADYFSAEQIVSAKMVNYRGKPAPDVFLYAANHFKVAPEDCLVIEDSVIGIIAAKAANMPVIGFLGGSHAQNSCYLAQILKAAPTMIAGSSIELLDILKKIFE